MILTRDHPDRLAGGHRSSGAASFPHPQGFEGASNLAGGYDTHQPVSA